MKIKGLIKNLKIKVKGVIENHIRTIWGKKRKSGGEKGEKSKEKKWNKN